MQADCRFSCRSGRGVLACLLAAVLPVAAQAASSAADEPDLPAGVDIGSPADAPDLPAGVDVGSAVGPEHGLPARAGDQAHGLEVQLWWQQIRERALGPADGGAASSPLGRVVLDFRREWSPSSEWRVALSNRLDLVRDLHRGAAAASHDGEVNSLREAWVSRRLGEAASPTFIDVGRINLRNGVGSGYNPTDFFKTDAVRAATSFDPRDLRFNRLGTVMLRAQGIRAAGAWTVALAPRLTTRDHFDDRTFALALERTNRRGAVYAKWAPQLSQRASIDALVFAREGEQPQAGLNGTLLVGNAVIINAEWAGGRVRPLVGPGQATPGLAWRHRAAINLTWTTPLGIELTGEYHYAGDALSRSAWHAWRNAGGVQDQLALAQIALQRAGAREPLVRSGWFMRAAWQDAFAVHGLDASAFMQSNGYDGSVAWQLKLSWRLNQRWSLIGQAGGNRGSGRSEFGSTPLQAYTGVYLAGSF